MVLGEAAIEQGMAAPPRFRRRSRLARLGSHPDVVAYLFLAPYLLLFVVFLLAPAIWGIGISFTEWDILGSPTWVGLDNFRELAGDPLFHRSVVNTLYFVVLAAVPLIALGLALALLLNQRLRGRTVARTLVFLPHVVMISAVGIIWGWVLDTNFGLLNYYLTRLGLPAVGWLSNPRVAMISIAITTVWWVVGTNMVIYLAGLQDIPEELYDAAKVDGAGSWSLFRHITFPMLLPVNGFVFPLTVIACWRVFGQVYVMTQGGPEDRTFVIAQYIYVTAFQNFRMGTASAAAVVLLLITLAFTLVQLRAMRVS
jgi:multiple sugar transport system permease protein